MERVGWMIAAPNERGSSCKKMQMELEKGQMLCTAFLLCAPKFRVGTLDALLSVSDRLAKDCKAVEGSVERLLRQFRELSASESAVPPVESKSVGEYVRSFEWDEARYASGESIKDIVAALMEEVARLEDDLKVRSTEFTATRQAKQALERKTQGNLISKSLAGVVREQDVVVTEHMTTAFVAFPAHFAEEFEACYESLGALVVPRSARLVAKDSDSVLYAVVVFKKGIEEFKNNCREKRYTVRDFEFDAERRDAEASELRRLAADADDQAASFSKWTETAFSEAYLSLVHLKLLRLYVEAVLRYGLTVDFDCTVLVPERKAQSRLRDALGRMYAHLSGTWASNDGHDAEQQLIPGITQEKDFYPYVYDELPLA